MGHRMWSWDGVCEIESGAHMMGTRVVGDCL